MKYSGFVYIWYDTKRKWYYIGSHIGKDNDNYICSSKRMLNAYNKRSYTFKRKILEYVSDADQVKRREQYWLNFIEDSKLQLAENKGNIRYYNVKKNASGLSGDVASKLKQSWWDSDKSNEWRYKLSIKMKTNNPCKKGNIPWNKGLSWNEEHKRKLSEKLKGRKVQPFTEEHKQNISQSKIGSKLSEETKEKIRQSRIGKSQTDFQKQRVSEVHKNKTVSEETKEKIRQNGIERSKEIVTCPHCAKVGNGPIMRRWHFTNCKYN